MMASYIQLTWPMCHFGGLMNGAVWTTKSSFSSVLTISSVLSRVLLNMPTRDFLSLSTMPPAITISPINSTVSVGFSLILL